MSHSTRDLFLSCCLQSYSLVSRRDEYLCHLASQHYDWPALPLNLMIQSMRGSFISYLNVFSSSSSLDETISWLSQFPILNHSKGFHLCARPCIFPFFAWKVGWKGCFFNPFYFSFSLSPHSLILLKSPCFWWQLRSLSTDPIYTLFLLHFVCCTRWQAKSSISFFSLPTLS